MKIQSRKSPAQELVQAFVQDLQYNLNDELSSAQLCRHEAKGFLRGLQLAGMVHEFAVTYSVELDRVNIGVRFQPEEEWRYYHAERSLPVSKPTSINYGEVYLDINTGKLKQFTGSAWEFMEAKWDSTN